MLQLLLFKLKDRLSLILILILMIWILFGNCYLHYLWFLDMVVWNGN